MGCRPWRVRQPTRALLTLRRAGRRLWLGGGRARAWGTWVAAGGAVITPRSVRDDGRCARGHASRDARPGGEAGGAPDPDSERRDAGRRRVGPRGLFPPVSRLGLTADVDVKRSRPRFAVATAWTVDGGDGVVAPVASAFSGRAPPASFEYLTRLYAITHTTSAKFSRLRENSVPRVLTLCSHRHTGGVMIRLCVCAPGRQTDMR